MPRESHGRRQAGMGLKRPYHEEPPSRSWRALTGAAAHRTSQSERLLRASASRARPARPAKKSIVPFSSGTRGPPILACTHQVLLSFCPSPGVPLQTNSPQGQSRAKALAPQVLDERHSDSCTDGRACSPQRCTVNPVVHTACRHPCPHNPRPART